MGLFWSRSLVWWMALQGVAGVGAAIISLAGTAAAADYFDEARRGTAMGWITTGLPTVRRFGYKWWQTCIRLCYH